MAIAKIELVCRCCGENFVAKSTKQTRAEADAWEAWARENIEICPECYAKAKREQKKKEEKERAIEWLGEHALPALTGSPKQIAWAEDIRYGRISEISEIIRPKRLNNMFWSWLENESSAKFWIESRDLDVRAFVELVQKEASK